ncbi:DUF2617 family protein [Aquisphaera insulae]|uniref:DUF2617 family protein n=1 Tax=Aquisphaera insulae TaxID=2712864 RepID=UPI0013ED1D59|nr:DUF2617 family protein [Aquisphaera insulae]
MGIGSGRAPVAELAFQVFGRALHPDWFATRAHRRVSLPRWEADVRIIEGGHAVIFRHDRARLTEILAGPETSLPEPGRLYRSPIRSERTASLHPDGSIEYQSCFEVEHLHPDVFRHLSEELTVSLPKGDLVHHLRSRNRLLPAPISQVHIEPRAAGLTVLAIHTFPDENAIVRSSSLCELVAPEGRSR